MTMKGMTKKTIRESRTLLRSMVTMTPMRTKMLLMMLVMTEVNISFTVSQSLVTRVTRRPMGLSL